MENINLILNVMTLVVLGIGGFLLSVGRQALEAGVKASAEKVAGLVIAAPPPSRRKPKSLQQLAEVAGGIDPVTVRLAHRREPSGPNYVELRIGEGRGEVRIALLTPRAVRQIAHRLLFYAAKADCPEEAWPM